MELDKIFDCINFCYNNPQLLLLLITWLMPGIIYAGIENQKWCKSFFTSISMLLTYPASIHKPPSIDKRRMYMSFSSSYDVIGQERDNMYTMSFTWSFPEFGDSFINVRTLWSCSRWDRGEVGGFWHRVKNAWPCLGSDQMDLETSRLTSYGLLFQQFLVITGWLFPGDLTQKFVNCWVWLEWHICLGWLKLEPLNASIHMYFLVAAPRGNFKGWNWSLVWNISPTAES